MFFSFTPHLIVYDWVSSVKLEITDCLELLGSTCLALLSPSPVLICPPFYMWAREPNSDPLIALDLPYCLSVIVLLLESVSKPSTLGFSSVSAAVRVKSVIRS